MQHYILLILAFCWSVVVSAQEIQSDALSADTLAADTVVVDSVETDTISSLSVQQRIDMLLCDDMFRTSQVGLMVYDLTADTLVYAINEKQTMRPASTMKLLTAITALDCLGDAYRYTTTMLRRGKLYANVSDRKAKDSVLVGNIIVRGGMDPRFGTDDMNAFIEALQKHRVDTIYGEVLIDRTFKDADLLGSGWCWDDDNPVLTSLPWNRKDQFLPKFLQRLRESGITILPRSAIPADSLGNALYPVSSSDSLCVMCSRYHSIDQILVKMMKDSDNLYAESMFYQIAASQPQRPSTAKHAIAVMGELIKKVNLVPSDYRIADGSGLSLYNYQSAELQVRLLRYAFQNKNIYGHLYPSLPVAGYDGTLKKRMRGTSAQMNVHAKTGTVTGVSSLSGYLTASNGNILCFAIINQGVMRAAPAKSFQDKVCCILCRY